MQRNKFLMAAATAAALITAGASAADAAPWNGYHRGPATVVRTERRVIVDHRVVFDTLRVHRVRYVGTPYFVRGHYVVKSFDRFNKPVFVEMKPYTGAYIGFIRL
ncbi:MAG TPA: hypothetical protein VG387_19025 [Rhizomicrobium sp.]|jgi:hypothetical protein|nr:hypothetical protein [Rhizomicrobium sp.]